MAASTFEVNAFANTNFEGSNSTKLEPIPEAEYKAVIQGPLNDRGKSGFRTTDKGQVILDVVWGIDDPGLSKTLGLSTPTVRQSVFLDLTASGGLDMSKGKNVGLGRLREALGQNKDGQKWSFGSIIGQVAQIKVTQRVVRDDQTGEENIYNDVKGVTKL